MAASPPLKVFDYSGEYVASCKHFEDAALLVGNHGDGACVKWERAWTLWTEGSEDFPACDSIDSAAAVMIERLDAKQRENLAKQRARREAARHA